MNFREYISKLYELYKSNNLDLLMYTSANEMDFDNLISRYGSIPEELESWWKISNGTKCDQFFFAVVADELTPAHFWSISEASGYLDYLHDEDDEWESWPQKSKRDDRIKPGWKNKKWIPFAGYNGFATVIMIDQDPASHGRFGQIIVYQHDPDAIYYVADSFSEFLEVSISLVEKDIVPCKA